MMETIGDGSVTTGSEDMNGVVMIGVSGRTRAGPIPEVGTTSKVVVMDTHSRHGAAEIVSANGNLMVAETEEAVGNLKISLPAIAETHTNSRMVNSYVQRFGVAPC